MSEPDFHVFLSHNSKDKPVVRELAKLLRERGIKVWLDEDELVPGEKWQPALANAIVNSATVAVCLGSSGIGPWEDEEMQAALTLAVQEKRRVIPVVLPSAPEKPELSVFLASRTWVDLRGGLTGGGVEKLVWGITGRKPTTLALSAPGPNAVEVDRRFRWSPGASRGLLHAPPAAWVSPAERNNWRYKVVAFDLDGTLLRGKDFVFSWERVWGELKVSKNVQQSLRREYKLKAETAATPEQRIAAYNTWCEAAVTHFRQRRLTRARLREIATPLELTANCREALAKLREEGVVTAIISGGISTFLEDRFPDFRDYVDFVFLNELLFDDDGVVESVVATAYDFEGKADALKLVYSRARCTEEETVFVGDQFNDEAIMLHAQLAIAYPPMAKVTADAAGISINEDDLTLILPHILVE